MKVGISGSKIGCNSGQRIALEDLFVNTDVTEFHHGDCVGVDAEGHHQAMSRGIRVVIHPPDNPIFRAFCTGGTKLPERTYRQRNRAIVDAVDVLWAFPEGPEESFPRSGTWMTVRMARKAGIPVEVKL